MKVFVYLSGWLGNVLATAAARGCSLANHVLGKRQHMMVNRETGGFEEYK